METNKKPDLLDDEQIIRKRGTHPSLTSAALIEMETRTVKTNGEVPLIEHENFIKRWSPSCESKGLGSKLSIQILGMVGTLCGCGIDQTSGSADILIKADKEQAIEKGISKLEQLNKMMVSILPLSQRFECWPILKTLLSFTRGPPLTSQGQ